MKNAILRHLAAAYVLWLQQNLESAGKAALHDLRANYSVLLDNMAESDGPTLTGIDADSLVVGMGWVLTQLRLAYPATWSALACESLRLHLRLHAQEIVKLVVPDEPHIPPYRQTTVGETRDIK